MIIYAVRDVKAETYGAPLSIAKEALAVRSFSDAVARPDSDLHRYPEDYMLFEIGSYDPSSGKLIGLSEPRFVTDARACLNAIEAARLKTVKE